MATSTQKALISAATLTEVNEAITAVNAAVSASVATVTGSKDEGILNDRQRQALALAVGELATAVAGLLASVLSLITEVGDVTPILDGHTTDIATLTATTGTHTTDIDALETDVTALLVMTTLGDIIVGGASGVPTRLAKGTDGDVLTMVAGSVAWETP